MKKPTIRNWIKYCAGTLAVSGMLVTTSCDSNNNQTADYDNEVEAVESEPTTPERENVNDEIAAAEEVETDADDRQTVGGTNDVDYTSNESQNQQASNRSSDRSAGTMPDMDSHIEEYKEPNQAIREELTDNNDMAGDQTMDRQNVSNTQTADMNQESATDMNRRNTTDMNQDASTDMNRENNQQGTTNDYQQTDDMNRQNTADMNQDTDMDRENVTNTDSRESYQYNTNNNQQAQTQQNNTLGEQQDAASNTQDTQYERQSNTDINQEDDDFNIIVIERYRMEYGNDMSDEERQRSEEIMNEYNTRRESMRGQINDETGAYISPETEASPKDVGTEQLINQIEENISYPTNALAAGMEGTVFVQFVVDENGNVVNARVADAVIVSDADAQTNQPLNPTSFSEQEIEQTKEEIKQEAIRAVEQTSGQWQAGQQNGQNVKSELQLPVRFEMDRAGVVDENR